MKKLQPIDVDLQCWQPVPPCSAASVRESVHACAVAAPPALAPVPAPIATPLIQAKAQRPWKITALRLAVAAAMLLLTGVVLASPAKNAHGTSAKQAANKEAQMMAVNPTESLPKGSTGTQTVTTAAEPIKAASAPVSTASAPASEEHAPVEASKVQTGEIAQRTPEPSPVNRDAALIAAAAGAVAGGVMGVAGAALTRRQPATKAFAAQTRPQDDAEPLEPTEVPQRPKTLPLTGMAYAAPDEVVRTLQRTLPQWKFQPTAANFALTSRTGHNDENQDYAVAVEFTRPGQASLTMALISDGCGGHFGGRHSAYTSVNAALNEVLNGPVRSIDDTVQAAMAAARARVADVGSRLWQEREFRCTLIVLLVSQDRYALSYIGDGGVDVRRANGQWERMLHAQKQEGTGYLTGSLGPAPYGEAQFCSLARMPGDVLIAGSDGMYVDELTEPEQFWVWPLTVIQNGSEALGSMLGRFVDMCIDTHPQVFHDNTTAFFLTTPTVAMTESKAKGFSAARMEGQSLNKKRLQAYVQEKSPEQVGG